MKPVRSALFVPGNRPSWLEDADEHGADAVIADLEDAVPPDGKAEARGTTADAISGLRDAGQQVFVRINGHPNVSNPYFEADIERIAKETPDALVVPKVRTADDVEKLDTVLTHVERREGIDSGTVELIVTVETALGMKNVYEACSASDRVASIICGATKGTDTNRALGFEWMGPGRRGLETLHMRQKALLDARAAGVSDPLAGTYVDIDDVEGLVQDVEFAGEMGYEGYVVIHPSHVPHVNEYFTPDEEEVEYWIDLYEMLHEAINEGRSVVRYQGEMIDTANLETATRYLRRAKEFQDDIGTDIDVDL